MGWYEKSNYKNESPLHTQVPEMSKIRMAQEICELCGFETSFSFEIGSLGPGCNLEFWQGCSDLNVNFSKLLGAASPFVLPWSYRLLNGQFWKERNPSAWHNETCQESASRSRSLPRKGKPGRLANTNLQALCNLVLWEKGRTCWLEVVHGQTCSTGSACYSWMVIDWKPPENYREPSGMRNSGCTWMVRSLLDSTELANLSDCRQL